MEHGTGEPTVGREYFPDIITFANRCGGKVLPPYVCLR
jgi:hypothetical protein